MLHLMHKCFIFVTYELNQEVMDLLTSLNCSTWKEGGQMSFASKIVKSIQALSSTVHSEPSYSFLAAEERKFMFRQQQASKVLEPVPNSMGWKKFGSWICQSIPPCSMHQGKETTLVHPPNFQSKSSFYCFLFSTNPESNFKRNLEIGWA